MNNSLWGMMVKFLIWVKLTNSIYKILYFPIMNINRSFLGTGT